MKKMHQLKKIHIGRIIREYLSATGISKTELARRIGMKSQNINTTILTKSSIHTDLLVEVSNALEHNFFDYFYTNTDGKSKQTSSVTKLTISAELPIDKAIEIYEWLVDNGNGITKKVKKNKN